MEDFIALKCPDCGGKMEVEKEKADELLVKTGDNYVFIGTGEGEEKIACMHCGTEFERRQEIQPYPSVVVQQGKVNVNLHDVHDSLVITTGGDLVILR